MLDSSEEILRLSEGLSEDLREEVGLLNDLLSGIYEAYESVISR